MCGVAGGAGGGAGGGNSAQGGGNPRVPPSVSNPDFYWSDFGRFFSMLNVMWNSTRINQKKILYQLF